MSSRKQLPNLIICGTPGVGKSRLCEELCSLNKSLKYININDLAQQNRFLLDSDEENQCELLNDDAINDYLDDHYFQRSTPSGLIIDYHSAGILPDNNSIHGIFVLQCQNDVLGNRLQSRKYSEKKLQEILQSESSFVSLHEAQEAFDETIVHELPNATEEDLKKNVQYLVKWIDRWPFNQIAE